jgi:hypothetical protein
MSHSAFGLDGIADKGLPAAAFSQLLAFPTCCKQTVTKLPYTSRVRLTLFLLFVSPCLASPVLTFSGSGADNLIAFQLTYTAGLLSDSGLHSWFYGPPGQFNYCTIPSETCNQVLFSAGGGNLTLEAVSTATFAFEFPNYIDNGVYTTVPGSPGTGTLTVTGSTDPVPEPRYGLLLGGISLVFLAWRRRIPYRVLNCGGTTAV